MIAGTDNSDLPAPTAIALGTARSSYREGGAGDGSTAPPSRPSKPRGRCRDGATWEAAAPAASPILLGV